MRRTLFRLLPCVYLILLSTLSPSPVRADNVAGDIGPTVPEAGGHQLARAMVQASVEPSSGVFRTTLSRNLVMAWRVKSEF